MRSLVLALAALIAAVIGLAAAGAAFGQQAGPACAPIEIIRQTLGEYKETVVWSGFDTARGVVLQLWQSPAGSWTFIVINANGTGCLVAEGEAVEARNTL